MERESKDYLPEKNVKQRSSINDLSDISEEDLKNFEHVNKSPNRLFRKITNARDRNYRDNKSARSREREKDEENKRNRNSKRSEIKRYNVRKIIQDNREISLSRSRSRSSRSPAHTYYMKRSPHSIRRRNYSRSRSPQFHRCSDGRSGTKKNHHQQDIFREKIEDKRKVSDSKTEELKHKKRFRRDSRSTDRILTSKNVDKNKDSSKSSRIGKKISSENLKIILQNEDSGNKRTKISKKDKKSKRPHRIAETQHSNFKSSDKPSHSDEISKEIIASGDNILISVSFANKISVSSADKEKSVVCITPDSEDKNSPNVIEVKRRSVSPQQKYKNLKPRSKERKRKKEKKIPKSNTINKNVKPIAFIDLDRSPVKEILSSPKEIIVLSDSENEILRKNDVSKMEEEEAEQGNDRPFVSVQVQQPVLKFSINKKSNLLPINLLHEHEDDKNEEDEVVIKQSEQKNERDLNDVYDPFNPTNSKSNSPTNNLQVLNDVSSSSDMIKNRKDKSPLEKNFFDDNLISSTNSIRNEKKISTSPLSSNLNNLKTNSFYENNFEFKNFKVPSPKVTNDKKLMTEDDATPYSPCSDGYQFDEAPPESPKEDGIKELRFNDDIKLKTPSKHLTHYKPLQEMAYSRRPIGKTDQNLPKSPIVKKLSNTVRSKIKRYRNSLKEYDSLQSLHDKSLARETEDLLFADDDVPNSAVDLLNKDKIFKKSLRIERVAEEVKLVLKPHYNKKRITKEEYKEVLRKAVPKIYHNKTGEINIQKIHNLVEAYIKKIRYNKRKSNNNIS